MKGSVGAGWCCGPAGQRNRLLCPVQNNDSSSSGRHPYIFKELQKSRVGCPQAFQAVHCDKKGLIFNNSKTLIFFSTRSWSREILIFRSPVGFKSSSCVTDWIPYRLLLGGGAMTLTTLELVQIVGPMTCCYWNETFDFKPCHYFTCKLELVSDYRALSFFM